MISGLVLTPLFIGIFMWIFSGFLNIRQTLFSLMFWYLALALKSAYCVYLSYVEGTVGGYVYVFEVSQWSTVESTDSTFTFYFDIMSLVMIFTVLFVASCVFLFAVYYMGIDPFFLRFMALLNIFTFCMLLIVSAGDLIQLVIGWELVGLCSYFLINYWYTRKAANKAANKAMLVNRIGDFALVGALALSVKYFNTLSIVDIMHYIIVSPYDAYLDLAILIFIAVMSKSAQFGLHIWLPDAMEGPTPVSALIHAATMVTAGVYLMIRLSILFVYTPAILPYILVIGSLTAIFGATTGNAQSDMKKIIAFSTCSQLGYMVVSCGLGEFSSAFYHLITHAFFKALLFVCAGVIIHSLNGEQDLRRMGGLLNTFPIIFSGMLIASLALIGFPYLSGFYSKEMIIGACFSSGDVFGFSSGISLLLAAVFTSLYSFKILYYVFIAKPKYTIFKQKLIAVEATSITDIFYIVPVILLSVLSIFGGSILRDIIVSSDLGSTLSIYDVFTVEANTTVFSEYIPLWIKILLNLCPFVGLVYYLPRVQSAVSSYTYLNNSRVYNNVYSFFFNRWYIDYIISYYVAGFISIIVGDANKKYVQDSFIDKLILNTTHEAQLMGSLWNNSAAPLTAKNTLKVTFYSIVFLIFFMNSFILFI